MWYYLKSFFPGFMPCFGPCWVNLYGSARDYSYFNENNQLNNGIVSPFDSIVSGDKQQRGSSLIKLSVICMMLKNVKFVLRLLK